MPPLHPMGIAPWVMEPPRKQPRQCLQRKKEVFRPSRGSEDARQASREAFELNEFREAVVPVPRALVPKMIGKGGQQLIAMRSKCGANIDARDQSSDPCKVKVLGADDSIEKARDLIWDVLELASLPKPGTVLEIPRVKMGKVLGMRGSQVNAIQEETGAKLDIDKEGDPCYVTVIGNDQEVERAVQIIRTLTMDDLATDGSSKYLDFPKTSIGAILGVKGSRLREMMTLSGARIDVDKTLSDCCRVRVSGTEEEIDIAAALIVEAVEAPSRSAAASASAAQAVVPLDAHKNDMASEVVAIPHHLVGKVIGKAGSTIHALKADTGARIWVDWDGGQAQITGTAEAVLQAKERIAELLMEGAEEAAWQGTAGPPTAVSPTVLRPQALLPVVRPPMAKAAVEPKVIQPVLRPLRLLRPSA